MDDFAIYVSVQGCGSYKITHNPTEPIVNNQFSFGGAFYASGTFNRSTGCTGSTGLNGLSIPCCGIVSGGPFLYTATWQHAAGSLALMVAGPLTVQPSEADDGWKVFR